jgi:hypothetical protein
MGQISADAASQVKAPLPDGLDERSFRIHVSNQRRSAKSAEIGVPAFRQVTVPSSSRYVQHLPAAIAPAALLWR